MANLLLNMIKGINLCYIKMVLLSPRFLVGLILNFGRFWKWEYSRVRRIRV